MNGQLAVLTRSSILNARSSIKWNTIYNYSSLSPSKY